MGIDIIMAIYAFIVPLTIVAIIIAAIIRGSKKEKSEESFQDIARIVYTYLIMIIFLTLLMVSVVTLFNSSMDLLLPIENDTYANNTALQDKNQSIEDFTSSIAMICISIPVFIYYSTIAKKERK